MKPFLIHQGKLATLDRANVDTDQIIPKQFLKSIRRTGFGPSLFFDWRYLADGSPDSSFELNAPCFAGATILVTRNNFGCGSSREHAVWAVQQYGFAVVVAPAVERGGQRVPAFADIFKNNCGKNAVLAVELTEEEVNRIFEWTAAHPGLEATADVERQTFAVRLPQGPVVYKFALDPSVRNRFLKGLDDIGATLEHEPAITAFEKTHSTQMLLKAVQKA